MKDILTLERKLKTKMEAIKEGKMTPKESEIGKTFNMLKDRDEASYEKHLVEYTQILKDIKN